MGGGGRQWWWAAGGPSQEPVFAWTPCRTRVRVCSWARVLCHVVSPPPLTTRETANLTLTAKEDSCARQLLSIHLH